MKFSHRLILDASPPSNAEKEANLDTNMVAILAALLCGLTCALAVNYVIRCVLKCARGINTDMDVEIETPPPPPPPPHLRHKYCGLKRETIGHIAAIVYGSGQEIESAECAICLGEFSNGEKVRMLPNCNHCYHVRCVDMWLATNSSCPTCRRSLAGA